MSDLQDAIVRTSVKAFNSGYLQGAWDERQRIIGLLEPLAKHDEFCAQGCYPEDCSAPNYEHAIELIKGEQK